MPSRPNILFMLSDDHAVRAISAFGDGLNHTPHLDRIAAEGAIFRESFCANSVCTPSRATILTGKHSWQNGTLTLEHTFDNRQPTFASILQQAGYNTAVVGKWHLHSDPAGFDFWKVLPGQGHYYNPDFITPDGIVREQGYSTDLITDHTIDWIRRQPADRPFLACCHFKAPHRPWMPHPRYFDLFADADIPAPETLFDDYANRCDIVAGNEMQIGRDLYWDYDLKVTDPGPNAEYLQNYENGQLFAVDRMTESQRQAYTEWNHARNRTIAEHRLDREEFVRWAYQRYLEDYLRCVQAIDDNAGRLLDFLEDAGLADNTIVVYCSDQGFFLGEHGWYDKRWMFEESMRMPLLMRWPGVIAPGSDFHQLVQNIDYAPTFLDAAGCPIPGDMHGASLLPVIREGREIHDELYYHYYQHLGEHRVPQHDGIRTDRYKLVHFYSEATFNLFDLEQDPSELRSVHQVAEYQHVFAQLKARYWQVRRTFEVPARYGPEGHAK